MEKENTHILWAGIEAISEAMDTPRPTFQQWKSRGFVPPSLHHEVVKVAGELELDVTHEVLHAQWKAAKVIKMETADEAKKRQRARFERKV